MKQRSPYGRDLGPCFLVVLACQFAGRVLQTGADASPSVDVADRAIVTALNPDAPGILDGILVAIDRLGPLSLQGAAALLVVAAFVFDRFAPARRAAAGWVLGGAVAQALANVLKTVVRRERPLEAGIEGWSLREILHVPDVARSFPSGHVTTSAVAAAGAWFVLGRLGVSRAKRAPLLAIPIVMSWDRVALGLHHPSDALAGICIGLACVAMAVWCVEAIGAARGSVRLVDAPPRFSRRAAIVGAIFAAILIAAPSRDVAGRDAVTGERVEGFRLKRNGVGGAAPASGPALYWARSGDLRGLAKRSVVVCGVAGVALLLLRVRKGRGGVALYALVLLSATWVGQFAAAARAPVALRAEDDGGVFVDWHLHGGDRIDGRHTQQRADKRQAARGVAWAITTRHDDRPVEAGALAHGVFGVEWSGGDYPRTKTAHVLVIGSAAAVDAAIGAKSELDAVRVGKANGALVIVAHHWRSAAIFDGVPPAEAFADAGADGFEVGNRYFDARPERRDEVRALDRFCRERGLLRVSFSDDHGVPSGSGAATFIEGVTQDELKSGGPAFAAEIISRLRRDAPAETRIDPARVRPLVFDDVHPDDAFDAATPWPIRYALTTSRGERVEWLAFAFVLWLAGRRLRSAGRG